MAAEHRWELSGPSSQLCCEPKTTLKNGRKRVSWHLPGGSGGFHVDAAFLHQPSRYPSCPSSLEPQLRWQLPWQWQQWQSTSGWQMACITGGDADPMQLFVWHSCHCSSRGTQFPMVKCSPEGATELWRNPPRGCWTPRRTCWHAWSTYGTAGGGLQLLRIIPVCTFPGLC